MYVKPVPNFYVGEDELTRLGISREKEVLFLNGSVTYTYDGELHTASFDDELDERHCSYRLNTALDVSNEMAQELIDRSLYRLDLFRNSSQPNAAAIIFTKSKLHARQAEEYIRSKWGYDPVILDDDVQNPDKVLAEFQNGNRKVIIAIRMLLEGVNIKRTRVITHLTNITARMSVIQMWTRGSRKEKLAQTGPSYIFCFKQPELVSIAESMDSVVIKQLISDDASDERDSEPSKRTRVESGGSFQPISAVAGEMVAVFRGQQTSADELRIAERYRNLHPTISDGLSDSQIAHIAVAHGAIVDPQPAPTSRPETYDEIKQRLKKETNKLANKIAQRRDVNPREVHQEWIANGGPRHDDASNEQLTLKLEWLAQTLNHLDTSEQSVF